MELTIHALCDRLNRATLRGSRDEWGSGSETLYKMYEALIQEAGETTIEVAQLSTAEIISAIQKTQAFNIPMVKEGLAILKKYTDLEQKICA